MTENNRMMQELSDEQLDMVNGGGFFDIVKDIRDTARAVLAVTKELSDNRRFLF